MVSFLIFLTWLWKYTWYFLSLKNNDNICAPPNSPVFLLVHSQTDRLRGFGSFIVAFRSLSLLSLLPWFLLEVQSAFRAAWTICGALYFYLSITNCFKFSEYFRENFLHIEFFFPASIFYSFPPTLPTMPLYIFHFLLNFLSLTFWI